MFGALRSLKIRNRNSGFSRDKDRLNLTQLYGQFNEDHCQTDLFKSYLVFSGTASLPDATRQ